jgi:hypothetical protein
MLWWDNGSAVARIEAILLGRLASPTTCQCLDGDAHHGGSFDVRAYHPNPGVPLFVRGYSLRVTKGLGGPTTWLVSGAFGEVGEPPSGPSTTPSATLGALLGADTKCAFSARLSVGVKTTNGSGTLTGLDAEDNAAFAAEITGP